MAKKNESYEILSKSGVKTFLTHGNILMSVNTFQRKLIDLYNTKNEVKISKRILNNYYDAWYDKLVEEYRNDFKEKFNNIVNIRFLKAERSYEVDCIIIERIGECYATN